MFLLQIRNRHFFLLDFWLLLLVSYLAFVLRLENFMPLRYAPGLIFFTVVVLVLQPLLLRLLGLYSTYWRYASVGEMHRLLLAVTCGAAMIAVVVFGAAAMAPDLRLPRSVPFIYFFLSVPALATPRLALRTLALHNRPNGNGRGAAGNGRRPKRVLIMGAGDAGEMILREIQRSAHLDLQVVGFIDDDAQKLDVAIRGVRVLGGRDAIPHLARTLDVQQVIIAMPTAPGVEIRDIVRICEEAGVRTKTMPGLYELLSGGVTVSQLRDVQIEDLLRREPVHTDISAVETLIRGRRVLITGAGGSIGSELCRQILRCGPRQMILLGHGENSIFGIAAELRGICGDVDIQSVIADIRFSDRMHNIFARYRPQIVFHAAAHKHVPLMEANPVEAITNNVLGTRNLLDAAADSGVQHFVMISTDKAVNPTSLMGASKRVAEMLVHTRGRQTGRAFVVVRFGNVLGSRGSVLLTFQEQIAAGGPLTVTHPQMTRYFMTIPEAVQLVLQAAVLGKGGEVFVLDMGEPVRILDLASDLIRLSGLEVGRDIEITFSGMRPGEKLFEELFFESEEYARTAHSKIFMANNAATPVLDRLDDGVDALVAAARRGDRDGILRHLTALLPQSQITMPAANNSRPPVEGHNRRHEHQLAGGNAGATGSVA